MKINKSRKFDKSVTFVQKLYYINFQALIKLFVFEFRSNVYEAKMFSMLLIIAFYKFEARIWFRFYSQNEKIPKVLIDLMYFDGLRGNDFFIFQRRSRTKFFL